MTILIIEDDLELRKELKVLLDYNGYQGIILQLWVLSLEVLILRNWSLRDSL